MKRSETPDSLQTARQQYIQARWTQLSDLSINWGDEAIKFLLFVNAGAMAGSLSFIGAMAHIRHAAWPKIALMLFVAGVVLVGVYHALRYHRTERLFRYWRRDTEEYNSDKLEWNDLLDRDEARSNKLTWPLVFLAYASFGCFLTGLLIAGLNFHEITSAPPSEASMSERKPTTPSPQPKHIPDPRPQSVPNDAPIPGRISVVPSTPAPDRDPPPRPTQPDQQSK